MSDSTYHIKHSSPTDIIKVVRNTRGRFIGQKATVDQEYYVLSTWWNNYGTLKLKLIDEQGDEFYTTDASVHVRNFKNEKSYEHAVQKYKQGLDIWREKNFIPTLVMVMKGYNGKAAFSATYSSILVGRLGQNEVGIWLPKRHCHPDDWEQLRHTRAGNAVSIRIPQWLAKKNKLIG